MNKLCVIAVRGRVNMSYDNKKTLDYLRLHRKNTCSVLDNTPENLGMVRKVKDFITWGTIDEEVFKKIVLARGELLGNRKVKDSNDFDVGKVVKEFYEGKVKLRDFETKYSLKPFFRLHPPIKGFERKGIKQPFGKGGVLGDRKDKINILVEKML
jgi:large subunit ribosomal protein L30